MFGTILAIGVAAVNPSTTGSVGGEQAPIFTGYVATADAAPITPMLPEEEPVRWDIDMSYLLNMLCYIVGCYAQGDTGFTTYSSPADAQDLINRFAAQGIEPIAPADVPNALEDIDAVRDKAATDPGVLGAILKLDLMGTLDAIEEELNAI